MKAIPCLTFVAILGSAGVASAEDLDLSAGTMSLGGSAAFSVHSVMPDTGDSVSGQTLRIAPELGYFVIDDLELVVGVDFATGMGDLYEGSPNELGFRLGAHYYLELGAPVIPYAGLDVGLAFMIPEEGDTTKALGLSVPLGVAIPLNEHVAVDAGARVLYSMSLEEGGGSLLQVPIGYFGVRGFF